MRVVVSPEYQSFKEWLLQVPRLFDDNQGELLYRGRNQIRLFEVGGEKLVVKRFKRNDIFKTLIYTFFRKNKAFKSYENARQLRQRGFNTPHEVAYMENCTAGLITQVYYVCVYTDSEPIRPRLIEQEPFDQQLAVVYARYVASLHEAGVLHRDLNPTNLTLFYWLTPAYRFILDEYAHQRGWTEADVAEAIRVKERHDRRWIRRKKITHLGKYEVLH